MSLFKQCAQIPLNPCTNAVKVEHVIIKRQSMCVVEFILAKRILAPMHYNKNVYIKHLIVMTVPVERGTLTKRYPNFNWVSLIGLKQKINEINKLQPNEVSSGCSRIH